MFIQISKQIRAAVAAGNVIFNRLNDWGSIAWKGVQWSNLNRKHPNALNTLTFVKIRIIYSTCDCPYLFHSPSTSTYLSTFVCSFPMTWHINLEDCHKTAS
jgi:hypothetical protein